MAWRSEFDPPKTDPERHSRVVRSCEAAVRELDRGGASGIARANLARELGREVKAEEIHAASESMSADAFASILLAPPAPRIAGINREDLVSLVERIGSGEGSDSDQDWWVAVLERNVPHPRVSNFIFFDNLSAKEVIDRALAYKPIILGPAPE